MSRDSIGRVVAVPRAALLLLLLLAVPACDVWPFGPGGEDRGVPRITELPRALTPAELAVIEGSARFGLDLLRAVAVEEGAGENVVLSPLSASMALGMTLEGTEGETFTQMRDVLGFDGFERPVVSAAYRDLLDLLYDLDPSVTFRIGNSVWHQDSFVPDEPFLDAVERYFDAVVEGLDFSSPGAVETINGWVHDQTEGRIEEIVEEPISALTVMFLINAIYFDGAWTHRFDPDRTETESFTLRDGTVVPVPMMKQVTRPTLVAWGGDYTAFELPYGGEAYAMTIVVPQEPDGLHDFVASLDEEGWRDILDGLREGEATVEMPRFRLEYEKPLGHAWEPEHRALQALGMEDAFSPELADFSRLHPAARQLGLYVHEVKQKTWIDVHEEGTEAAAVTSVEIGRVSAPPVIRVDRPFLFALRERLSGTLLFLGMVEDPRGD